MGLITIIIVVLILALAAVVGFVLYIGRTHEAFFKKQNVHFVRGTMSQFFGFLRGKISIVDTELFLYKEAKAIGKPFVGITDLTAPLYFIMDLDLHRTMYVKDFDHFVDRRPLTTEKSDLLMRNMLFSLEGEPWKGLRAKLSPTFTTGRIRKMFNIFDTSSHKMCGYIRKRVGSAGGDFDITEAYSKYAMDVIASCAFGIDSKSFDTEPGALSTFEKMGNKFQLKFDPSMLIKYIVTQIAPKVADFLGVKPFKQEPQEYFMKVVGDVMEKRREAGERRDDFLQLLMDAQEGLLKGEDKETMEVMTGTKSDSAGTPKNVFASQANKKFKFGDIDVVANAVMFLLGGYDTLQSLLIFSAYNLALHTLQAIFLIANIPISNRCGFGRNEDDKDLKH